ncbi:hypothetical protein HG530_011457 [Fusarium avenaceum]|nr:hypothetical protein HG530_011457 [Fusarium avenaceum]
MHRLQNPRMKILRCRHKAKVCTNLPPSSQINLLPMYIRNLSTGLLKQQHGSSMIPSFGVAVAAFVHPDRGVAETHGQNSPPKNPGYEITAWIRGVETRGDDVVDAVEG